MPDKPSTRARQAHERAKADAPTSEQVIAGILAGEHDVVLGQVWQAVATRAVATDARWRVELPSVGVTVTEDDLTLDEAYLIEKETGTPFVAFNPVALAAHVRALLLVVLQTRHGLTAEQAVERIRAVTKTEVVAAVSRYTTEVPTGPETSTSGS